jgi:hypothetical protein
VVTSEWSVVWLSGLGCTKQGATLNCATREPASVLKAQDNSGGAEPIPEATEMWQLPTAQPQAWQNVVSAPTSAECLGVRTWGTKLQQ